MSKLVDKYIKSLNEDEVIDEGILKTLDLTYELAEKGFMAAAGVLGNWGRQVFRLYLSKARVSCKNAPDKTRCIQLYHLKALDKGIMKLKMEVGKCPTGDSNCVEKLNAKINSLAKKRKEVVSWLSVHTKTKAAAGAVASGARKVYQTAKKVIQ